MKKSKYLQILSASVASGSSVRDAAGIAGCTESTAYSLSCTPEFKTEVSRLKSEAVSQAVAVLTNAATKAAKALEKLLDSQDEKIILASAVKLLAILPAMQDLSELRARVDSIENQASLRIAR
ncbi:MAG: hypothetical protein WKF77_06210 [Planctomycetaceae bacterium]